MERSLSVTVRGVVSGLIGAAALALWFLVIDLIRGEPFGSVAFLSGFLTGQEVVAPTVGPIVLYTLVHVTLFIALGVALAHAFARMPVIPNLLTGVALGLFLFASVFYASLIVTGVEVISALGWPHVLIGDLLAGIGMMEALRWLSPRYEVGWWESLGHSRTLRDGLVAGVLGATVLALWFLVPDLLYREPFFTPGALGSAIFLGITEQAQVEISLMTVGLYTVIHYGIFILVGLLASGFMAKAEESPRTLLLGMLFIVSYGTMFIGIVALFGEWILGALAWWAVLFGTVVAVLTMASWLIRAHPHLRTILTAEEGETSPAPISSDRWRSRRSP